MIIDEDIYLEHWGVKGMRWGVRNENRQARRDKKAQKYLAKADIYQTRINKLNKNSSGYSWTAQRNRIKVMDLTVARNQATKDAKAKSQGKLSQAQRRTLIGAGVVGAAVLAYGTYASIQSGEATRLIEKGKDFFVGKNESAWKLDRSLSDQTMDADTIYSKVVSKINPDYGAPGTKVNCRRATFAYEMRRRGYDVAATRTTDGRGQTMVGMYNAGSKDKSIVPGTRTGMSGRLIKEHITKKGQLPGSFTQFAANKPGFAANMVAPNDILSSLSKQPNGARGELGMMFKGGGGHSMAWEIVQGKPVIFDTQTGKTYKSALDIAQLSTNLTHSGFTRLDDKALNTNFLMRWVKNA